MRTGKELILATRPYTTESQARSWWYMLSTLLLLVAAVIGTLWNVHLLGRLLCSILLGLLTLRLFVIYHDQQHHAILRGSRVAEMLMQLFGLLTLSPTSIWRSSHNHHHAHNSKLRGSHIGSFPIMTSEQYLKSSRSERFKYLFMRHPLTILMGYFTIFGWGMCLFPLIDKPRRHIDCALAIVLHLGLGALLLWQVGWLGLLLTQTLPMLIASAIGSYLFYAQHNFPGVKFADRAGWTYEKAASESSSYIHTGPIMAWFTANIGYHHIHHLNARIPFYRLPELMRDLPELASPTTITLGPRDIFRCLHLKVWDVDTQTMVSVRSLRHQP